MYRNIHAAGIKWEKCLICLLNGLTVGFKKALLTFGCEDQEERLYCIMRMRTKGELVVYLQSAKNNHEIVSRKSQTFSCQTEMEKEITLIRPFLTLLKSICFQKQHDIELGCPIWKL